MPKKRSSRDRAKGKGARTRGASRARSLDLGGTLAGAFLAFVLAGSALVFDTAADASFDAPKRLVFLLGTAAAALAAFGFHRWGNPFSGGRIAGAPDPRLPVLLLCGALALAGLSALASPRRTLALDAFRIVLLGALLLLLGASRVIAARRRLLASAFLAAAGLNAAVSVLQARGLYQPFPLVTRGDREATGAFAGNVGYLALALALAAVLALGLALTPRRAWQRIAAGVLAVTLAAALLVNQNITSLSALAVGIAVLLFALYGGRALLPLAGALLLLAAGVAAYRPMRTRASEALSAARAGDWDRLLSYRTAPWAAALRMARDRPLLGVGPGTFEAEFVSHRLEADIAERRRLVNPLLTSTYAEAHCDYLQPFAEAGIPAGLAAVGAVALLLAGLARAHRAREKTSRVETALLLALLAAGATAALTWFPLQRPITAAPLLLAAGRGWRLWRDGACGDAAP